MLYSLILKLKQNASDIAANPVIDAFEMAECEKLDTFYNKDPFITSKINNCLKNLKDQVVHYNSKFRSAYEEYNEALIYLSLKEKEIRVNRIFETSTQTPDFEIVFEGDLAFNLNMEVKSLSFLEGNLNYNKAQNDSLEAKIDIEEQFKSGKRIAFGEYIVSPFLKNGEVPSQKGLIEIYIDKINQNIKKGQYTSKDTVLVIDIKQLILNSAGDEGALAFFQDRFNKSIVSGVLWNVAFGQADNLIFQSIEFESKPNIDSKLSKNGILIDHPYIKALVFATYHNFNERHFVGFLRHKDLESEIDNFLLRFCEFYNDDLNSQAYKVLQRAETSGKK